jgi:hypothetical protein
MKIGFFTLLVVAYSTTALYAAEPAKKAEPQKKVVATEAPAEASGEMINKATCTKGTDSRELEIVAKGDGHVVSYTKAGEAKEVGNCSMDKKKCQAVFDQIKSKLEGAGFACKI